MSCSLLHHNTLRFPPPHKYPVCSILPFISLPGGCMLAKMCMFTGPHVHDWAPGHQVSAELTWHHLHLASHADMWVSLPSRHTWLYHQGGPCLLRILHCPHVQQMFLHTGAVLCESSTWKKSENIVNSETEMSPRGYQLFMQVLVE